MPSRKRKVVGLFRPISRKELKGYSRTLSNPLGVTTLATVNGRGRSARSVARTESPAARLRRAKQLLKGASSMRLTTRSVRRNPKKPKLSGPGAKGFTGAQYAASRKKEARKRVIATMMASRAARKQAQAAAKEAAAVAKAAKQEAHKAKRMASLAKAREARSKKARSKWPSQYTAIKVTRTRKVQTGFGPYKRVLARKPTGKQALSWLYAKRKGGKLTYRKIPASAIKRFSGTYKTGSKKGQHTWTQERIDSLRAKASARITKRGGAWVPNRRKEGPIKTKKHAKLMRAMRTLQAKGYSKTEAARKALKKYPIAQGQIFAGFMRVGKQYVTCATRTSRSTKEKTSHMKRVGSFTRNRKSRRRLRVARRSSLRRNPPRIAFTANRRRRAGAKRRSAARRLIALRVVAPKRRKSRKSSKSRRSAARRRSVRRARLAMTPNRRRSRKHARRHVKHMRANGRRHVRRHARRHMRRNGYRRNGFMADLLNVLKTGAIVGAGFLTHRLLSNLVVDFLLVKSDGTGLLDKMAEGSTKTYLKLFAKPLSGLVVVAAGIPLAQAVLPSKKVEVGAGMVASLIQQILISGFMAASKSPTDSMATAAKEISGYESGLAYSLHGQGSIMPRYAPVGEYFTPMSGLGQYSQAAAGMGAYSQAAAGFSQAAAGYNATGEYFAPASLQGIGQYEGAGEQALLPSANQQVIDDGLRPDGDLDSIFDLAESAAGVHGRRGVGEYFSAQRSAGGGFSESVVPMRSQWIPNGPLFSGTLNASGSTQSSEVPAGILASGGGNGILSG
jgi:hypothetical protein